MKIDRWIVIEGKPVFTSKTRKQARTFIKKNKITKKDKLICPKYHYIGKCVDDYHRIILDI